MIDKSVFLLATGLGAAVLDRVGKSWATQALEPGERVALIGDWLSAAHVESSAAVMGLFSSWSPGTQRIGFCLIALACVVLVLSFYRALTPREHGTAAALGAILGGVSSNAFDRFDRGTGLDFLHLGAPDSTLPDFNFADVAILLGVVTLIVELLANEMASRAEERTRR